MIAALAWRNIWRQPVRTALSLGGMAFTAMLLVFMISFQFGSYDTMKSSMLRISEGFGQIQPIDYKDDPEVSKTITNAPEILAELADVRGITASAPRSVGFVLLANGERTFAAAVTGIDPALEGGVSKISSMVRAGRPLEVGDDAAIVLGEGLARNLRLELGDRVTMLGSGLDGSVAADVLTLVGVFASGVPEIDRQIARMPIQRFSEAFLMDGAVNVIAISGDKLPDVEASSADLRAIAEKNGLVYLDWSELAPEIKQAISLDMSTAFLMFGTLIVVVVFVILNTLYMSVLERTREFGVLLAVGMKPGQIGKMVWMEIIFLTVLGNAIGIALGMALTYFFEVNGIAFEGLDEIYAQWGLPSRFYPDMTPSRVLSGPGLIILSIALLGVIPYRRVLGLEPVKAMNS